MGSGLTSFTAPYFINKENLNWGARYAYIWAGSNFVTFGKFCQVPSWKTKLIVLFVVFFYFFLPELKGRTLEELDELFQNRVSVRDFPHYQCVSSENAKQLAIQAMEGKVEQIERVDERKLEV